MVWYLVGKSQVGYPQISDLGIDPPPARDIWWSLETCSNLFFWEPSPGRGIWWCNWNRSSSSFQAGGMHSTGMLSCWKVKSPCGTTLDEPNIVLYFCETDFSKWWRSTQWLHFLQLLLCLVLEVRGKRMKLASSGLSWPYSLSLYSKLDRRKKSTCWFMWVTLWVTRGTYRSTTMPWFNLDITLRFSNLDIEIEMTFIFMQKKWSS